MDSKQIDGFLSSWCEGVIEIGKTYLEGGDFNQRALNFLSALTMLLMKWTFYLNQLLQSKLFLEII